MTNKERLISFVGFNPSDNAVEGALVDAGMTGSQAYNGSNSKTLKTLAIQLMELLLTTPNHSNNITGFSVTYDRDAVMKRIGILKDELGLGSKSTIRALHMN